SANSLRFRMGSAGAAQDKSGGNNAADGGTDADPYDPSLDLFADALAKPCPANGQKDRQPTVVMQCWQLAPSSESPCRTIAWSPAIRRAWCGPIMPDIETTPFERASLNPLATRP